MIPDFIPMLLLCIVTILLYKLTSGGSRQPSTEETQENREDDTIMSEMNVDEDSQCRLKAIQRKCARFLFLGGQMLIIFQKLNSMALSLQSFLEIMQRLMMIFSGIKDDRNHHDNGDNRHNPPQPKRGNVERRQDDYMPYDNDEYNGYQNSGFGISGRNTVGSTNWSRAYRSYRDGGHPEYTFGYDAEEGDPFPHSHFRQSMRPYTFLPIGPSGHDM